jgi:hypothetical protein
MPKATGSQPYQKNTESYPFPDERGSEQEDKPKTLNERGISYKQSHQWQKLADVPEEDFEAC